MAEPVIDRDAIVGTVVYDMVRSGKVVAQVIALRSGKCVVAWPTSTVVYDDESAARAVHIAHMGGRGETTRFAPTWSDLPEFDRGRTDCYQDDCENAKFASIGGLDKRHCPQAPRWASHPVGYLRGYVAQAEYMYGSGWRTCEFSWGPALAIGDEETSDA